MHAELAVALHSLCIETLELNVRDDVSGCSVTYLFANGLGLVPIVVLVANVLVILCSCGT